MFTANEFSGFFKDTWKVRPDLTLNLGIHYEWFGVPYDSKVCWEERWRGKRIVRNFLRRLDHGSVCGQELAESGQKLYDDDWNNFAPSFGLSWSLPWFGKDKTVLRAGYGWSYTGNALKNVSGNIAAIAGSLPGTFGGSGATGLLLHAVRAICRWRT